MWNGKCRNINSIKNGRGCGVNIINDNDKIIKQINNNAKVNEGSTIDGHSIISSCDVSISGSEMHCCSAEARNPAMKRGRQLQLIQVN